MSCIARPLTLDVVYLAKVRIFQQITTHNLPCYNHTWMSFTLQRYEFFSKSQLDLFINLLKYDVVYLAKVRIFQQITTYQIAWHQHTPMSFTLQRYEFFSKSQRTLFLSLRILRCRLPCKGTNFLANHNRSSRSPPRSPDVVYLAKVRIFQQITTSAFTIVTRTRCRLPCKGTNFLANHNRPINHQKVIIDVVYLAKVRIFQQITTREAI